jgi:hypothetical protein
MDGALLVRATIAASLAAYAAGEWMRVRGNPPPALGARRLWTTAVILCAVHTVLAFQTRYHWSHAAAAADGAAQVAALTGWRWAGVPYVNYAFLVLWAADTVRWWRVPCGSGRDRIRMAMSVVVLFMFVNGAVVFARGPIRPVGVAALLVVATAWVLGPRRPRRSHPTVGLKL